MAEERVGAGAPTSAAVTPSNVAQAVYGVGQIAGQVFRDVPSLLLLFFMTNALGIQPALAGAAIFGPKLVCGIVFDLSVGLLSDRFKDGVARRWWLLAGAVGAPAVMILLFHVPHLTAPGEAAYIALAFSLYMLVFAVFSVPYLAIAGELSSDPRQRTVIMAWRLVFTAVGVLIAGSFAPIFIQSQGGGRSAFEKLSILLAVICPLALVFAFGSARRAGGSGAGWAKAPASKGFPVREALAALAAPRFSLLVGANLLQLTGSGMAYASMIYFITYDLGRADAFKQIGLITLIASATIVVAQPLWVALARRLGKKHTYIASSLFYGAVMAGWGALGRYGIGVSYLFAAALGLANSGWSLMGFSLVSDLGDDGRGGLYASVWVAADKIGFALGGALLVGLLLQAFGFDAARALAGLPQSDGAMVGVLAAFCIAPATLSVASALLFTRLKPSDA